MKTRTLSSQVPQLDRRQVRLEGWVHRLRDFGGVRFLVLRDRAGLVQVVLEKDCPADDIASQWVVAVEGTVRAEPRAPSGFEVLAKTIEPISRAQTPPLDVFRPPEASGHRLETILDHRPISLRIPEVLDIFRVQAEILRAFRAHLNSQGFTEIVTPKLVLAGAEGGSALFEVKYFDRSAYLAQSPQFYKQMMVGSGLERVFEVGHAYRAEKSETSRHLTEFASMDFEMGFIEDEQDVMRMHSDLIRAILMALGQNCAGVLERRGITLPEFDEIPQIDYPQAKEILAKSFGKTDGLNGDLDTEGERLICQWSARELGSELIFVTGYAMAKRPLYTMPRQDDPAVSRSFDLLYRGVEITTGSQRVHDYDQLVAAFRAAGHDPAAYVDYLSTFKHGMCPHGGMGMGLERLTAQVLGLSNVKQACLFPRDRNRLTP